MVVSCTSLQPTLEAFYKCAFFFFAHVLAFDSLELHFPRQQPSTTYASELLKCIYSDLTCKILGLKHWVSETALQKVKYLFVFKYQHFIHNFILIIGYSGIIYVIFNTAAAAKSLQSCPTLCDPIDGSPPGASVPGILQARILEWVAISSSNA